MAGDDAQRRVLTPEQAEVARSGHLVSGDPLRGIALLAVLAFHTASAAMILRGGGFDYEAAYGQVGSIVVKSCEQSIYVFFALSAYLLGKPWAAAAMGRRPWPDAGVYLLRRALRILPAFWVTAVIILVLYGRQGSSLREVVAMFTLLQVYDPGPVSDPLGHAWSLDVEVVFYLLLPLVALACARAAATVTGARRKAAVATGVVAVVTLVGYGLRDLGMDPTPSVHSPLGLVRAFLLGILFAVLDVRYGRKVAGWRPGPPIAAALMGVGVVLTFFTLAVTSNTSQASIYIGMLAGGCLVAGPILLQRTAGRTWWVLDNRVTHWFGERSYSIFLLHGIPTIELRSLYVDRGDTIAAGAAIAYVPILAASCLGAVFLYRLVEAPARDWAHRPRAGERARATSPAGAPPAAPAVDAPASR